LLGNYQVALCAIPAFLVQKNDLVRVNMNNQREFSYFSTFVTLGTFGKGAVFIWIQEKVMFASGFYLIGSFTHNLAQFVT